MTSPPTPTAPAPLRRPPPRSAASGGVPVQSWDLCKYGSELIWQLSAASEQSGSVDILAMLTWLVNHRYLPADTGLWSIGYGWEICSTGGVERELPGQQFLDNPDPFQQRRLRAAKASGAKPENERITPAFRADQRVQPHRESRVKGTGSVFAPVRWPVADGV